MTLSPVYPYMTSLVIVGRRACALLAAVSAGLHAVMLGHASNAISAALLAVMITACLFCAWELWREGTVRAWVVVALMNLAMIAVHLPAPAHAHHGVAPAGPPTPSTLMATATLLAVIEVLAAAVALYVVSRGRTVEISGRRDH
jgi:hypothetical protein